MNVTLITGASSGIGEALATKLAEQKHNLLLIARNANRLDEQCRRLSEKFGIVAQYIAVDLTTPEAIEQIHAEVSKRGLAVELLINNAGVGSGGEFSDLPLSSELAMLQLNLSAVVALTHHFLQGMKQRKRGTIVNVGSMIAFMPVPYMAVYGASKAFIRSFTQALAEECRPYNVNVMLFSPGLTETNFMSASHLDTAAGQALTAGAVTQTSEEVAEEFIRGFKQEKKFVVSGKTNKIGVKLLAMIPNSFIAKQSAKGYRKRMSQ